INIKRHASCSLTHRSIDGVIKIVTENNIKKEDIKSIECYSSPRATKVLFYTNPQTELEAKFSMQYVLAVAALYQDLTPKQFSKENISKTDIQILMKKVIFDIHPDWIDGNDWRADKRSEEHTSELQSREISYAVFCLKKKKNRNTNKQLQQ